MSWRHRTVTAVALLAVGVAGISVASASTLTLAAAAPSTAVASAPCGGVAAVTNPSSGSATPGVALLTVPADCVQGSRSVQLTLVDPSGAHSSSPVQLVAGPQQVTLPAYAPAAVTAAALTVDGWDLDVAFSYTVPTITCAVTSGSGTCEATVTVEVRQYCILGGLICLGSYTYYDVEVTSTSPTAVTWQVTLHLGNTLYAGVTDLGNSVGNTSDAVRVSCSAPGRTLVLSGGTAQGFRTVSATTARAFSLVVGSPSSDDLLTCL